MELKLSKNTVIVSKVFWDDVIKSLDDSYEWRCDQCRKVSNVLFGASFMIEGDDQIWLKWLSEAARELAYYEPIEKV